MVKGAQTKDTTTKQERELDFRMAREAAGTFGATATTRGLDAHSVHFVNMGRIIPSESAHLAMKEAAILKTLPVSEPAYGNCTDTYGNWQEADLYGKCIYACVGHHSSTWLWNYNHCTGTWDQNIATCNHGSCANDSSMGFNPGGASTGYTNSGWNGNYDLVTNFYAGEQSESNSHNGGSRAGNGSSESGNVDLSSGASGQGAGVGCTSGYNWNTPPGHECNDDSSYQMWQVHDGTGYWKGNTSLGNGSTFCYMSGSHGNACNCSSSCNSCSGDWGYPDIPPTH
jgi:hypothetical protein